MTLHGPTGHAAGRGFTIVEFMVALLLGTILIGGAVSVYLASSRSFEETERSIELLDSGRFALQILGQTLRRAGFSAGLDWNGEIARDHPSLGSVDADCASVPGVPDAAKAYGNAFIFAVTANGSGEALDCIDDAQPGTDVLVVRSLRPVPISDADPNAVSPVLNGVLDFPARPNANTVYLLANAGNGDLISGTAARNVNVGSPIPVGTLQEQARSLPQAWPYSYQVFYVRLEDRPSPEPDVVGLARMRLEPNPGGGMRVSQPENLVRGVEDMRIRFRYASTSDGDVDRVGYAKVDISGETHELGDSLDNWNRVGSVEVFLLVRSLDDDPAYLDEKTYTLGDRTVIPLDDDNLCNECWRLLVDQHVSLRNSNLVIQLGGG